MVDGGGGGGSGVRTTEVGEGGNEGGTAEGFLFLGFLGIYIRVEASSEGFNKMIWLLVLILAAFSLVVGLSVGLGIRAPPEFTPQGPLTNAEAYFVKLITEKPLDDPEQPDIVYDGRRAVLLREGVAVTSYENSSLTAWTSFENTLYLGDSFGNVYIVTPETVSVSKCPDGIQRVERVVAPHGVLWVQYTFSVYVADRVVTDAEASKVTLGLYKGSPAIRDSGLTYVFGYTKA
jgi:hypothetical protein